MSDTFNSKGMLSGPDTCLRIYSIQEVGGQRGGMSNFEATFAPLVQLLHCSSSKLPIGTFFESQPSRQAS